MASSRSASVEPASYRRAGAPALSGEPMSRRRAVAVARVKTTSEVSSPRMHRAYAGVHGRRAGAPPRFCKGREGTSRAPLLSALPMERQLCAGNRDDLGNLQVAGMWQPRDPRSAPAGASPLRPSQHCCRYGPRQHCSFHRPPAAPCLLFSMHEGYASRQTAPFVGCALQMPNGSPDHTASSLWLRPRSVSPAIPFASNAASHSSVHEREMIDD